jgi:hypothetical protein
MPDSSAAQQLDYTHEVQVHDVGLYRFKGISNDFSIKSVNLAALAGRVTEYTGGLQSNKAKQVAKGQGHERVCRHVTPSDRLMCLILKESQSYVLIHRSRHI